MKTIQTYKNTAFVSFFMLLSTLVTAQQAVVSAGSSHSNSSGYISYSVGQTAIGYSFSNTGSVQAGVLHFFDTQVLVEEISGMSVSIFPNPTQGQVWIQFSEIIETEYVFEVYTITGIQLQYGICQSFTKLDFAEYPPGIYLITIRDMHKNLINQYKITKK